MKLDKTIKVFFLAMILLWLPPLIGCTGSSPDVDASSDVDAGSDGDEDGGTDGGATDGDGGTDGDAGVQTDNLLCNPGLEQGGSEPDCWKTFSTSATGHTYTWEDGLSKSGACRTP